MVTHDITYRQTFYCFEKDSYTKTNLNIKLNFTEVSSLIKNSRRHTENISNFALYLTLPSLLGG